MSELDQLGFRLRFGWGPNGLRRLAPRADVVVIVDVLSFSTSVDVALGRGAVVLPYRWGDGGELAYAAAQDAVAASRRPGPGRLSLRPSSLTEIEPGTRLVLPSPNGSALTFAAEAAGARVVYVACCRNASAVAAAIEGEGGDGVVAIVAAGERWKGSTGPLRPAVEDLLGAGAVLARLTDGFEARHSFDHVAGPDVASPEARAAAAAFRDAEPQLADRLHTCASGRELIARGFEADVPLAAALDASELAPRLRGAGIAAG